MKFSRADAHCKLTAFRCFDLRTANLNFIPRGLAAGILSHGVSKGEKRSSPLWSPHGVHTPWWRNQIEYLRMQCNYEGRSDQNFSRTRRRRNASASVLSGSSNSVRRLPSSKVKSNAVSHGCVKLSDASRALLVPRPAVVTSHERSLYNTASVTASPRSRMCQYHDHPKLITSAPPSASLNQSGRATVIAIAAAPPCASMMPKARRREGPARRWMGAVKLAGGVPEIIG